MLGLGTGEIIAIILVVFLLFGATRLPQLARSIGQSRKAFKDAMREAEESEKSEPQKPAEVRSAPAAAISSLTDEEIFAEMKRRTEARQ